MPNMSSKSGWQPSIHHVQGIGKDRRITISLSETIFYLDIEKAALSFCGFRYCADFYESLLAEGLKKISGTSQRQIFKIIEKMVFEAITQEINISCVRRLLRGALLSLENGEYTRIGSLHLWTKHRETINNLLCRLDLFQIEGREEDDKLMLMDLPKECIYNIVSRLSNPKDIANLGQTCSYLNIICNDSLLWKNICFRHFSEKEVASLTDEEIDFCDTDWKHTFYLGKGQYLKRVSEIYGDEIVLCDNCRKLFWRIYGHPCSNPDMKPSKTVISPQNLVDMLRL